jgi:hypothetical protein
LSKWNGEYQSHLISPLIYQLWIYYITNSFYAEKYGEEFADYFLNSTQIHTFLLTHLEALEHSQFTQLAAASFLKRLKAYKEYQNGGEFHQLRVQHILGNIPLLASKYHFGDYAVNGFSSTMNKTSSALTEKPYFETMVPPQGISLL